MGASVEPDSDYEFAIERFVLALAIQAGMRGNARFDDAAIELLVDQNRSIVVSMLSHIGHLVHYGAGDVPDGTEDWLAQLHELLVQALRKRAIAELAPGSLLPGDLVELEADRGRDGLPPLRVYFVGADGTVDVGWASLQDDYVISRYKMSEVYAIGPIGQT